MSLTEIVRLSTEGYPLAAIASLEGKREVNTPSLFGREITQTSSFTSKNFHETLQKISDHVRVVAWTVEFVSELKVATVNWLKEAKDFKNPLFTSIIHHLCTEILLKAPVDLEGDIVCRLKNRNLPVPVKIWSFLSLESPVLANLNVTNKEVILPESIDHDQLDSMVDFIAYPKNPHINFLLGVLELAQELEMKNLMARVSDLLEVKFFNKTLQEILQTLGDAFSENDDLLIDFCFKGLLYAYQSILLEASHIRALSLATEKLSKVTHPKVPLFLLLINLYTQSNEETIKALHSLENTEETMLLKGIFYLVLGKLDEANHFLKKGNSESLIGKIAKLEVQEESEQAIDDLTLLLSSLPEIPMVYLARGKQYFKTEQWTPALADLSHAIFLERNYVRAYFERLPVLKQDRCWRLMLKDINFIERHSEFVLSIEKAECYFKLAEIRMRRYFKKYGIDPAHLDMLQKFHESSSPREILSKTTRKRPREASIREVYKIEDTGMEVSTQTNSNIGF